MLTRVDLKHFKCFRDLKLPLSDLTVLSGANATGKSSILQALVLLHQTMNEQEWTNRLLLNGTELKLGTVADLVDKVTGRRQFSIGVVDDSRDVEWVFEVGNRDDMSASVASVRVDGRDKEVETRLHFMLPDHIADGLQSLTSRLRRLVYLTAERVGPREIYVLQDQASVSVVGPRGENTVSVMHRGDEEKVLPGLAIDGVAHTRPRQVEAHMAEFFPGFSMDVRPVPHANAVTLGLRTSDATDFHRPVHVGFGLTQVLPIVVGALSAGKSDLLLIENPEVHLHPAGQSMMGQFLAKVAGAGVQVILETHSDHVLNGIRRGVRAGEVEPQSVCIHFFRNRTAGGEQVVSPAIGKDGNIDVWPDGFFDQFDRDMNHFAGWGE